MNADELRVLLRYLDGQIIATEWLLETPLSPEFAAYQRRWLTEYQMWRDKLTEQMAGKGADDDPR